jgi:hypothetical protein
VPRRCSICTHGEREAIDLAIVEGGGLRDIARQHGVSKDAVARHGAEHLPATLARAAAAEEATRGDTLLEKVQALEVQAREIAKRARQSGDLRVALAAVRELARIIELQARLAGDLIDAPTVSVVLGDDWTSMRSTILSALNEYPEARVAVARALGGGQHDA